MQGWSNFLIGQYMVGSRRLSKETLKWIRQIGYNFLWNGRRGRTWGKVTLRKEEGGLDIKDFEKLDEVTMMKDAIKIWDKKGSAWSRWMRV